MTKTQIKDLKSQKFSSLNINDLQKIVKSVFEWNLNIEIEEDNLKKISRTLE